VNKRERERERERKRERERARERERIIKQRCKTGKVCELKSSLRKEQEFFFKIKK